MKPERAAHRIDEEAGLALGNVGDDDFAGAEWRRGLGNAGKREAIESIVMGSRLQQAEEIRPVDRPPKFRAGVKRKCHCAVHPAFLGFSYQQRMYPEIWGYTCQSGTVNNISSD
jgi:hypothetical protein